MNAAVKSTVQNSPVGVGGPGQSQLLQRKCACGGGAGLSGECDECDREKLVQRHSVGVAPPAVPPIVHEVLRSPGTPLDAHSRTFMESRFSHHFGQVQIHPVGPQKFSGDLTIGAAGDLFEQEADDLAGRVIGLQDHQPKRSGLRNGYDFSQVRIHTDARAAQSAREVGAAAYTVGRDIVFGSGQFAPDTERGQALLAHELTHVVQQSGNLQRATLQRSFGSFLRNIFIQVPVLGFLFHFTENELQEYLRKISEADAIEDDYTSDNKAEAIATSWNKGEQKFVLTARLKALLIREMLSGYVSDDEESAILGLLERADNPELQYIFGAGQVTHEKILAELTTYDKQLYRFYQRRYASAYPAQTTEEMLGEGAPPKKPDLEKLKSAEAGGRNVERGDKLPESASSIYSGFKKETKRRTDVVSVSEADAWINEVYGQFLPADKKRKPAEKKGFAETNIKLTTEAPQPGDSDRFESFFYYCFNLATDAMRRDKARMEEWKQECQREETHTGGFYDKAAKEMTVRTDRETPITRLHEVVHAYAHDTTGTKLTRYANEGLTEYITRQVVERHKLKDGEKRPAISQSYGGPYDLMLELQRVVGDAALAKAHFQGDVESIANVVGQPTFAQMLAAMESSGGSDAAVKLLRDSRKPAKKKAKQKKADISERKRRHFHDVEIGEANDPLELEADETAERIGLYSPALFHETAPPSIELAGGARTNTEAGVDHLSSGKPLQTRTRTFFESALGHDFSDVRVHTDTQAAESARETNALAYTLGRDIVFGEGRFAPETHEGSKLLAHELTHVVQQQSSRCGSLQRKGGSFTGFFSNIGRSIASIFGGGEGFAEETLQVYLKGLDDEDDIEDDYDSDFKARAVIKAWKLGGSPYVLTEHRKALLIREMQEGFTGDDDELAILEILERSYNFELSHIFGAGGVSVSELNSDFHGAEWDRLKDFYGRRFEDGDAMVKGTFSKPTGLPVPLGAAMPIPGSWMTEDLPGASPEWNVPCVLGLLCSEDKDVVAKLPSLKVQKADKVTEVYWEYDGSAWKMKTRERGAFSNSALKTIGMKKSADCATAASNVIHEVHHQGQPDSWTTEEKEKDAYTFEEEWTIKRGLPARPKFRTTKPGTKGETVDVAAIEKYVADRYSGKGGAAGEQIIDHTPDGKTVVKPAPGAASINRAAKTGDSHQDYDKTKAKLDSLPKVDPKEWVCPVRRSAIGPYGSPVAPESVYEVLRSPGRPLERSTIDFMTARSEAFGGLKGQKLSSGETRNHVLKIGAEHDAAEHEADHVATELSGTRPIPGSHALPYDFTRVRVHTGERAAESARAVNALAYTVGNNIVFGAGQYAPNTSSGQRLLAHELTHVAQGQHHPAAAVQRAPIKNAAGDYTSFEFVIGTELTLEFAELAQKLAADKKIDDADLGKLAKDALDKRETVNDNERMFMAGLMDVTNAKTVKSTKLKAGTSIVFDFKTISPANVQHVIDLNRQGLPASVTKLVGKAFSAIASKNLADALSYTAQAEGESLKQITANAGSFTKEAAALISYAQAIKLPLTSVLQTMLAAASDNSAADKVMAGTVFAIASQVGNPLKDDLAAGRIKVDALSPTAFATLPTPVPTKAFYVTKAMPTGIKGDTIYLQTNLDIADLNDRSTVIHELRHAEEDKAASTTDKLALPGAHFPPEREMEGRAYRAQAKYIMDQMVGKSATDQTALAKSILAAPVNELVLVALMIEGQKNTTLYEPILDVIFDTATGSYHLTAAQVKTTLSKSATSMETLFLDAIEKGYGMTSGKPGVVEGLSGESLIHYIFRF